MAHSREIKERAIALRKKGKTYDEIASLLGLQKSTLSYWFLRLEIPIAAQERLRRAKESALIEARKKSNEWHRADRLKRIEVARKTALDDLSRFDHDHKELRKLALAMLYLGEGFKRIDSTGMGNSDPLILKSFVYLVKDIYGLQNADFRCQLHLRMDQSADEMKKYWSAQLGLPLSVFKEVNYDKRSIGMTYDNYHGVCQVRCRGVAIKRELIWFGREYCASILGTESNTDLVDL